MCFHRNTDNTRLFSSFSVPVWPLFELRALPTHLTPLNGITCKELSIPEVSCCRTCDPFMYLAIGNIKGEREKKFSCHIQYSHVSVHDRKEHISPGVQAVADVPGICTLGPMNLDLQFWRSNFCCQLAAQKSLS